LQQIVQYAKHDTYKATGRGHWIFIHSVATGRHIHCHGLDHVMQARVIYTNPAKKNIGKHTHTRTCKNYIPPVECSQFSPAYVSVFLFAIK